MDIMSIALNYKNDSIISDGIVELINDCCLEVSNEET